MKRVEEVAKRHGFPSATELLAVSFKRPMTPSDTMPSYVGTLYNDHGFLWEASPVESADCELFPAHVQAPQMLRVAAAKAPRQEGFARGSA